ncbi:hypothetical protein HYV69_00270 [Candidatus Uhrbacteria bacterium]|nr:hypothetical protein [Candidatus Uhrbacteria bacterium]
MKYLSELELLKLPTGKFAIFGSGSMAVRGIRESEDLDIIVKQDLWDILVQKYPMSLHDNSTCLKIGNVEIFRNWLELSDRINEMIENAETIASFPFVQLKYVIEWKKQFGREKDKKDIELIQKYIGAI